MSPTCEPGSLPNLLPCYCFWTINRTSNVRPWSKGLLNWTFELLTFLHVAKHLIAIVFTIHLFIFECFDVYIANWFSKCLFICTVGYTRQQAVHWSWSMSQRLRYCNITIIWLTISWYEIFLRYDPYFLLYKLCRMSYNNYKYTHKNYFFRC